MFSFGLLKSRLPCQEEAVHMCMHSLFCMSSLDYIICGGGADPQPRALHHRFRGKYCNDAGDCIRSFVL